MRIIHGCGYSDEDRFQHVPLICRNVFNIIQSLIGAMEALDISYDDEVVQVLLIMIKSPDSLNCHTHKKRHIILFKVKGTYLSTLLV